MLLQGAPAADDEALQPVPVRGAQTRRPSRAVQRCIPAHSASPRHSTVQ